MQLPTQLFIGQVIAMLSIPLMYFATPMQIAICALMYFGINCLGMTMGYHRYFAHKTFNAPKWLEYVMLFFGHIHMVAQSFSGVLIIESIIDMLIHQMTHTHHIIKDGSMHTSYKCSQISNLIM